MHDLGPTQLALFAIIIIVSYAVRGSAGFGGVTVPLLVYILSMKIVVPVVTFLGVISSAVIVAGQYKHIDWKILWRVTPASLAGALCGLYFFSVLDARTLARALGAVTVAYGLYSLWRSFHDTRRAPRPAHGMAHVVGATAGFVATLFGSMAGMFYAMYLDLLHLDKHEFRATAAAILLGLGLVRAVGYMAVGVFDHEAIIVCLVALPLMGIGVFLGGRIHANLNSIAFQRLIALVLMASGTPLLLR